MFEKNFTSTSAILESFPAPDMFLKAILNSCSGTELCGTGRIVPGIIAAKRVRAGKSVFVENNSPIDFKEISNYIDLSITRLDNVPDIILNQKKQLCYGCHIRAASYRFYSLIMRKASVEDTPESIRIYTPLSKFSIVIL